MFSSSLLLCGFLFFFLSQDPLGGKINGRDWGREKERRVTKKVRFLGQNYRDSH